MSGDSISVFYCFPAVNMVKWEAMKTTIEIPDELFKRTKLSAVDRGVSLKRYVSEALEARLVAEAPQVAPKPWMKLAGVAARSPEMKRELRRIEQLVAKEFGRVDEEDWR